jgi:hypothetical protein
VVRENGPHHRMPWNDLPRDVTAKELESKQILFRRVEIFGKRD